MIHAVVVLQESKTESGSPVLGGHPCHARSQTDSITFVIDNTKVASEVQEQTKLLNLGKIAAEIRLQDKFMLGFDIFGLLKGVVHFSGYGERRAFEAVTDFWSKSER